MRWIPLTAVPEPQWSLWRPDVGIEPPAVFIKLKPEEVHAGGAFHTLHGIKHVQLPNGTQDRVATWSRTLAGIDLVLVRVFPFQLPDASDLAALGSMQMCLEWCQTLRPEKPLIEGYMLVGRDPHAGSQIGGVSSGRHWIGLAVRESQ
jgi:hypothetical protein